MGSVWLVLKVAPNIFIGGSTVVSVEGAYEAEIDALRAANGPNLRAQEFGVMPPGGTGEAA